jgi:hypothetical protein
VSKWEKAVDEDTLQAELTTGYRQTEEELEHGGDILKDEAVEDEASEPRTEVKREAVAAR